MRRNEAAGDPSGALDNAQNAVAAATARESSPSAGAASSPATLAGDAPLAPVRPEERIASLDVLRGIAVLGILLTNVVSFALPAAAFRNPTVYGGAEGADLLTWFVSQVLVDGKFRAIFCMLFGASVILLLARAERRSAGVEVADVYYRRTLWLIVFGVVHGYCIWFGDILFHFGVVGLTLFPLRKLSGRTLCVTGACILLLHTAQTLRASRSFSQSLRTVARHEAVVQSGQTMSDEEDLQLRRARESRNDYQPSADTVRAEIDAAQQGYLANLRHRSHATAAMQSDVFYRFLALDVAGTVLLGMGLMKLGVLDGSRSTAFYAWVALLGYGLGLPINIVLNAMWVRDSFDLATMFRYTRLPYDLVRVAIALGHIAVVMVFCKAGLLPGVTRAMSRVGRMALSNYLLTSVLCSLFFYGYGLGMFGRLERHELLYVVTAVWALLIAFSAAWLARFRFGPMEWLWRSLTYWRLQPMRLADTRT